MKEDEMMREMMINEQVDHIYEHGGLREALADQVPISDFTDDQLTHLHGLLSGMLKEGIVGPADSMSAALISTAWIIGGELIEEQRRRPKSKHLYDDDARERAWRILRVYAETIL